MSLINVAKPKPHTSEIVEVFDFIDEKGEPIEYSIEVRSINVADYNAYLFLESTICQKEERKDWPMYHAACQIAACSFNPDSGAREFKDTVEAIDWMIDNFSNRDFENVYAATVRVNGLGNDEKKSQS